MAKHQYYNPRRQPRPKPSGSKTVLLVVLCVVLFAAVAVGAFFLVNFLLNREDAALRGPAPIAYHVEGDVMAIRLEVPTATDEAGLTEYFAEAVAFAQDNDINTLIFEAKQGLSVWWRDSTFPLALSANASSSEAVANSKLDPMALLCAALQDTEIQLWLEIDPYASGNFSTEAGGRMVEYVTESGSVFESRFAADDETYRALCAKALSQLPQRYPIAGLVFSGFGEGGPYGSSAQAHFAEGFGSFLGLLHENLAEGGHDIDITLAFGQQDGALSCDDAVALQADGLASVLLPTLPVSGIITTEQFVPYGSGFIATPPLSDTGLYLFTAARSTGYEGALLASYPTDEGRSAAMVIQTSSLLEVDSPAPERFEIPQVLDITYPVEGVKLTWEGVYITGHSNPDATLTINGETVPDRAPNGAFGIFMPLELGDNTFQFQNGDVSATKVITRVEPKPTTPSSPRADGSKEVQPGTAVRFVSTFTNVLTDYNNLGSINEIFNEGAVAIVQESKQFYYEAYNQNKWAYRLSSGDWVWAINCGSTTGDGRSAFTGLTLQAHEKGEYLLFEGSGTPAAYIEYGDDDGTLKLTMYDTSFTLPNGFQSQLVSSASVEEIDGGVVLTLQTNNIWGYNIEYADGQTKLFLKQRPVLGQNPAKPLEGVTVLLDPGHGAQTEGSNYGAVGIAGEGGYPHEKDINLALANGIAYRLRQLGATVSFTREDDSNPSINERYIMQLEQKPDFFLSVHHDGLDGNTDLSEREKMIGIYYHPYNTPPSKAFAQNLLDSLVATTGRTGEEEARWGGVNYGVIRTTVCPSVLYEYGLIVHPQHYFEATDEQSIWASAFATVEAIMTTLGGPAGSGAQATGTPPPDTSQVDGSSTA